MTLRKHTDRSLLTDRSLVQIQPEEPVSFVPFKSRLQIQVEVGRLVPTSF